MQEKQILTYLVVIKLLGNTKILEKKYPELKMRLVKSYNGDNYHLR